MPKYVDGFVIPVPKSKIAAYRAIARKAGRIWREYGALDYKECVGDDLKNGFCLSFPKGIGSKPGETIMFSWIVYKSRRHRDRVNAKVMNDPRIAAMAEGKEMPFDSKRMLYGGFAVLVD